jgi:hypothetical protein
MGLSHVTLLVFLVQRTPFPPPMNLEQDYFYAVSGFRGTDRFVTGNFVNYLQFVELDTGSRM